MPDALLAEVLRGGRVESAHGGAAVVADADGNLLFAAGDVEAGEFPRSAVKALLALPLVESGAADRLGLTDAELALACASHTGEERHVAAAAAMLGKAGCTPDCLECGVHWPTSRRAAQALAARGEAPGSLHNNCSGKHAGFICLARDQGATVAGYVRPEHPVMRQVWGALAEVARVRLQELDPATDGCAIPTYAMPLRALASGFARFGSGSGLSAPRAQAAARLRRAVAADPFMVAGHGRFDTRVMTILGGRVFSKIGAEGIVAAALPEHGIGIAIKCRDGAGRAAEVAMAQLIASHLPMGSAEQQAFQPLLAPTLVNWNGEAVGRIRARLGAGV